MKIKEYPDREILAMGLADVLASELKNCLLVHPWASFVVPGGTTPGPIFDSLCAAALDWDRVHVMLSDERWVPEDHDRSNAKLLKDRLFVDRAAAATFIPFHTPGETPESAAPILSEKLAGELPISLLLLGMGADMHRLAVSRRRRAGGDDGRRCASGCPRLGCRARAAHFLFRPGPGGCDGQASGDLWP